MINIQCIESYVYVTVFCAGQVKIWFIACLCVLPVWQISYRQTSRAIFGTF